MATLYGANMLLHSAGTTLPVVSKAATVRAFVEVVTLATQTTSDVIEVGQLPKGAKFLYGVMTTTATLGASATVAIGITGSTGKYRTAATFTTTDTPTFFGNAAATNVRLTADETIIVTIAVASLPAAGTWTITMVYAHD